MSDVYWVVRVHDGYVQSTSRRTTTEHAVFRRRYATKEAALSAAWSFRDRLRNYDIRVVRVSRTRKGQ